MYFMTLLLNTTKYSQIQLVTAQVVYYNAHKCWKTSQLIDDYINYSETPQNWTTIGTKQNVRLRRNSGGSII